MYSMGQWRQITSGVVGARDINVDVIVLTLL